MLASEETWRRSVPAWLEQRWFETPPVSVDSRERLCLQEVAKRITKSQVEVENGDGDEGLARQVRVLCWLCWAGVCEVLGWGSSSPPS